MVLCRCRFLLTPCWTVESGGAEPRVRVERRTAVPWSSHSSSCDCTVAGSAAGTDVCMALLQPASCSISLFSSAAGVRGGMDYKVGQLWHEAHAVGKEGRSGGAATGSLAR